MLEQIFGKCTTKQRIEINRVMEEIYDGRFPTVERALKYYDIDISSDEYEKLIELVLKVKQGAPRELFEIDGSKIVKFWYTTDLNGERIYCARIANEEEWKRAVDLMVRIFGVDTAYGTIEAGVREFCGPDIYLFGKYERGGVIDNPGSNYHGCSYTDNFLWVNTYEGRREKYLGFLQSIIDRESKSSIGVVE